MHKGGWLKSDSERGTVKCVTILLDKSLDAVGHYLLLAIEALIESVMNISRTLHAQFFHSQAFYTFAPLWMMPPKN